MMGLLATILSQGGTQKHQSLLMPALQYCLGVWERTAAPQAAASTDADLLHVRAVALATQLSLLRYRWRSLAGGGGAKPAAGGDAAAGAHSLAAAAAAAAAGGQQQQGLGDGPGAAIINRVLQLLHTHFAAAGGMEAVLAAADVRLLLEELYELQAGLCWRCTAKMQACKQQLWPLPLCLCQCVPSRQSCTALTDWPANWPAGCHQAVLAAPLPAAARPAGGRPAGDAGQRAVPGSPRRADRFPVQRGRGQLERLPPRAAAAVCGAAAGEGGGRGARIPGGAVWAQRPGCPCI